MIKRRNEIPVLFTTQPWMGAAQRPDKAIAVTCMCDVKQQNQTQTIKTTTNDFLFCFENRYVNK